jgi:hypothetical protein
VTLNIGGQLGAPSPPGGEAVKAKLIADVNHGRTSRRRDRQMSENGPREGTRDLPHRDPDARYRAVDGSSAAGVVYQNLAQWRRRRRAELLALAAAGGTLASIAAAYQASHPLEPQVSAREITAAVEEARTASSSKQT